MLRTASSIAAILVLAGACSSAEPTVNGDAARTWAERLEDPGTSEKGVAALVEAGEAAVPVVALLLEDSSPRVRERACLVAGRLTGMDLFPRLVLMLEDEAYLVCRAAADALGRFGARAKPAIPALIRMIADEDACLAAAAGGALWRIGPPGVDAMLELLPTPHRPKTIRALAAGGADAIDTLCELLGVEGQAAREGAGEALARIGWRALPRLEDLGRTDLCRRVVEVEARPEEDHEVVFDEPLELELRNFEGMVETGWHHGKGVTFERFRGTDTGLEVLRFSYVRDRPATRGPGSGEEPLSASRTVILRTDARALLLLCRYAASARMVKRPEVVLNWRRHSSHDLHDHVSLFHGDRVLWEDGFTGFSGSRSTPLAFRVRHVNRAMAEILREASWTDISPAAVDRDELRGCLEVLVRARLRWWIREHLLALVGTLGDRRFLPVLRRMIERPLGIGTWDHLRAIESYARISGCDLRPEKFGVDQVPAVREKYLEHWRSEDASLRPPR